MINGCTRKNGDMVDLHLFKVCLFAFAYLRTVP